MDMSKMKQYAWVLYGILSILIIFGVALLYTPVANLSAILHPIPAQLATPIDLLIPVVPAAIIVYWYVFYSFIFFSYFYFAFVQREYRNTLVIAYVLINAVAYVVYLVFPVIGPSRIVPGTDFFSLQLASLYSHDTPLNCFPSLHGSMSLLAAYSLSKAKKEYGYISWPIAIAVMISTLFVHQHWIADQVFATVLTLSICYFVFNWFKYTRVLKSTTQVHMWQLLVSAAFAVLFMVLYVWAFYVI